MANMNPRKQLVFLILFTVNFLVHSSLPPSHNTTFEFQTFPPQNFTLLGDSYLRNGVAGLTLESSFLASSAGTIMYTTPVRFSSNRTNSSASFFTRFSFSIVNLNPLSPAGDGLTFFISPEKLTLGSTGGYLGLVTKNKFIAIEYDTRLDQHFNDPNDNHVGLDIDSLNSIKTTDCMDAGIDLRTGISFTSWIEYDHSQKNLKVFLTRSRFKPNIPLLNMDIDLSSYFQEHMYLGFSGSTEGSTETHLIKNWKFKSYIIEYCNPKIENLSSYFEEHMYVGFYGSTERSTETHLIKNWKFKSYGIEYFNPRINKPHAVTDESVITTPPVEFPVNFPNKNYHKLIRFGLEVSGTVIIFSVLAFLGFRSYNNKVDEEGWQTVEKKPRTKKTPPKYKNIAKDDAFEHFRKPAFDLMNKKKALIQQAKEAGRNRDRHEAKRLFQEANSLIPRIAELHQEASDALFEFWNQGAKKGELNLHGQLPPEAVSRVKWYLQEAIYIEPCDHVRHFRLIIGWGSHGTGEPKMFPPIRDFLNDEDIAWKRKEKEGWMDITLKASKKTLKCIEN